MRDCRVPIAAWIWLGGGLLFQAMGHSFVHHARRPDFVDHFRSFIYVYNGTDAVFPTPRTADGSVPDCQFFCAAVHSLLALLFGRRDEAKACAHKQRTGVINAWLAAEIQGGLIKSEPMGLADC